MQTQAPRQGYSKLPFPPATVVIPPPHHPLPPVLSSSPRLHIPPSAYILTHSQTTKKGLDSRSPLATFGIRLKLSATGTVPVFSIFSSRFSCSSAARSASSSSSSMGSVMGMEVMALPISWVSSCCSRSCSLRLRWVLVEAFLGVK